MPEVDVDHFRKPLHTLDLSPEDYSTDAPKRPVALDSSDYVEEPSLFEDLPSQSLVPAQPSQASLGFSSPASRLNFDRITTREELMHELSTTYTLNEFNLPNYVYRVDLLDPTLLRSTAAQGDGAGVQDILTNAVVKLDYSQGFPTFSSGSPFWSQMAYESKEAFSAFLLYLDQPGIRTLHLQSAYPIEQLLSWFHIYCWNIRGRAYDMFKAAHHDRMRFNRIMKTEDSHYLAAEAAFTKVNNALKGVSDEDMSKVEPDKLVGMMERISRIQRVSAGLPASGVLDESKTPTNVSIEVQMRTIAKKSRDGEVGNDEFDASLLQDPATLALAQELIVKVSK